MSQHEAQKNSVQQVVPPGIHPFRDGGPRGHALRQGPTVALDAEESVACRGPGLSPEHPDRVRPLSEPPPEAVIGHWNKASLFSLHRIVAWRETVRVLQIIRKLRPVLVGGDVRI